MTTFQRLDQALRMWEDLWFLVGMRMSLEAARRDAPAQLLGPVAEYRQFRAYLRSLTSESKLTDFPEKRFVGFNYPQFQQIAWPLCGSAAHPVLPCALMSWTINSRRVFHVTPELQVLLNATDLDGITWGDVSLPFDSFAVSLELPVEDDLGRKYDCLLFGLQPDYRLIRSTTTLSSCMLFGEDLSKYHPITGDQKRDMEEWLLQRDLRELRQQYDALTARFVRHRDASQSFFASRDLSSAPVLESTAASVTPDGSLNGQPKDQPHLGTALRIVAGLCLYLQTLPIKSPNRSEWHKPEYGGQKIDKRLITNDAQVCMVSCSHKLSAQELEVLGGEHGFKKRSLYELCAHFRRGHWRRPPGQGSNPDAPKTVWVRPTLVRRDRLHDGALPGGSTIVL